MSITSTSSSPDEGENNGPSPASSSPSNWEFIYKPGDRVFCYHGSLMYEARCVRIGIREGIPKYFIHYHGWNKSWDEWVEEERMREYNTENKQECERQKLLNAHHRGSKRLSKSHNQTSVAREERNNLRRSLNSSMQNSTAKEDKLAQKRRRRAPRASNPPERIFYKLHEEAYKFPMSDILKKYLIDDYYYVHKERKIVKLSEENTIQEIFEKYIEDRFKKEDENKSTIINIFPHEQLRFSNDPINSNLKYDSLGPNYRKSCYIELTQGLKNYFNQVVGTQLLYNIEHLQYYDLFSLDLSNNENSQLIINIGEKNEQDVNHIESPIPTNSKIRSRKNSDIASQSTSASKTHVKNKSSLIVSTTQTKKEPCELYSAIHLLRLFTKMGSFLQYFNGDKGLFRILGVLFADFLQFLEENHEEYLSQIQYVEVTSEYLQRSMNISTIDQDEQNYAIVNVSKDEDNVSKAK